MCNEEFEERPYIPMDGIANGHYKPNLSTGCFDGVLGGDALFQRTS